jgi:hypothetical protein
VGKGAIMLGRRAFFSMAIAAAVARVSIQSAPVVLAADLAPLIDNERVTVFDTKLATGPAAGRPGSSARDAVIVFLSGPSGIGTVTFQPKGASAAQRTPDGSRAIVIELSDRQVPPLRNTSGYPAAFPRPGAEKVLENARVVVWDYSWAPGVPTPMHFHDKDVVVVYLEEGALKSTTPDGQSIVNELSFGLTKFNARDRAHTEELVKGKSRAIIVELK